VVDRILIQAKGKQSSLQPPQSGLPALLAPAHPPHLNTGFRLLAEGEAVIEGRSGEEGIVMAVLVAHQGDADVFGPKVNGEGCGGGHGCLSCTQSVDCWLKYLFLGFISRKVFGDHNSGLNDDGFIQEPIPLLWCFNTIPLLEVLLLPQLCYAKNTFFLGESAFMEDN
jgi:hypothetical protein